MVDLPFRLPGRSPFAFVFRFSGFHCPLCLRKRGDYQERSPRLRIKATSSSCERNSSAWRLTCSCTSSGREYRSSSRRISQFVNSATPRALIPLMLSSTKTSRLSLSFGKDERLPIHSVRENRGGSAGNFRRKDFPGRAGGKNGKNSSQFRHFPRKFLSFYLCTIKHTSGAARPGARAFAMAFRFAFTRRKS